MNIFLNSGGSSKHRRATLAVVLIVAAWLTSIQGVTSANATPTVTRSLPAGSNLYSMSCDHRGVVPNGQLGGIVTSSGVPTGAQTRIGSGTTHDKSTYCAQGAAYNPVTQTGYWVSTVGVANSLTLKQYLFSISSAGVSTYVNEIRADTTGRNYASTSGTNILVMYGITFDAAGNMYAMWRSMAAKIWIGEVTLNNSSDDGKIVHSSVKELSISNLYSQAPHNFAFNSVDNKFYTAGTISKGYPGPGMSLYEINIATGLTTDKGQSGDANTSFWGMQFDSNGVMWGGDARLNSATVSGWTSSTDLQQSVEFTNHYINAAFIAPNSSTSPSAPTLNSVTAEGGGLSVSFTAGANGGAAITDYEYSLNGGTYISAGTTTSPFSITSGIVGGTSYSVALKAKNSIGLSSASGSLSVTANSSVTFDPNGGSGTMNMQTGTVAAALSPNTLTRTGYTFEGWAGSSGGSVVYADRASYAFTSSTTLYAIWTINPPPVVYIPPPPQPYLLVGIAPAIRKVENLAVCSSGTYDYGVTYFDGTPNSLTKNISPAVFLYKFFIDGAENKDLAVSSAAGTISIPISKLPAAGVLTCQVTVERGGVSIVASSTLNTAGVGTADAQLKTEIEKANLVYQSTLKANADAKKSALIANRKSWRDSVQLAGTVFAASRTTAKSSKEVVAASKIQSLAVTKAAANYKQGIALIDRDYLNMNSLAENARKESHKNANSVFASILETNGYGVTLG